MEKVATKFSWEKDTDTGVLKSIEIPDLTFKDRLRFLKSKRVKIG